MPQDSSPHFDENALLRLGELLRVQNYAFTTVTPATHARVNARPQNEIARDLNGVFGWSRPFSPQILPARIFDLLCEARAVREDEKGFHSLVRVSTLGDCHFFHSAFPTEQSDAVFFGPDTYRYARALQWHFQTLKKSIKRAVDIGSGAGPGAILTARQFPDAQVFGADINEAALLLSRVNAKLNATPNFEAHFSDLLGNFEGEFDLIIANPPYLVDENERAYRHGGGPLGAGLSLAILETALERLAQGGSLLLYTGVAMMDGCDPFFEEVRARLSNHKGNWDYQEMDVDIFGEELETRIYGECDRIAAVILTIEK